MDVLGVGLEGDAAGLHVDQVFPAELAERVHLGQLTGKRLLDEARGSERNGGGVVFSWVATYKTTGGADAAAAFVILIWVLFWEFFALILHTSTQSYNGSFIFAVILTIYVHFVLYITMQISHLKNKLESSSFPPKRDAIRERKMKLLFLTIALILILT